MKLVLKTGLLCLLLCTALLGAGVWYLRSSRFQDWARDRAVGELEKATGLHCSIAHSRVDVLRGAFILEGLAFESPAGTVSPVGIAVDELRGSVRMKSMIAGGLHLSGLQVIRPRITLSSGQMGSTWNPEEFLRSFRKSLDVAVGTLHVEDGWIQLDYRQIPFGFLVREFTCEVEYLERIPGYRLHVAYKDGKASGAVGSFSHDVDMRATLSMDGIDFQSVGMHYSKSSLSATGTMRNWRAPTLMIQAKGTVAATDLSVFDYHLKDARGDIAVASTLRWDAAGYRTDARFSCESGSYHDAPLTAIRGVMTLERGILGLRQVEGKLCGGPFVAEADFRLLSADRTPHRFRINISDARLKDAAAIIGVPAIAYENTVSGGVRLSWKHGYRDMDADIDLVLAGAQDDAAGTSTPLRGNAALRYSGGVWYLPNVDLHSPATTLSAVSSSQSVFHIQLHTSEPREIFGILRGFSPRLQETLGSYPDLMNLSGSYDLAGDVRIGPAAEMAYQGSVQVAGGHWRSYSLDSLTARAYWDGGELDMQSLSARRGEASASGSLHLLRDEVPGSHPQVSFKGSLQRVALESLKDFGINPGQDLTGTLSGIGSLSLAGQAWQGEGQLLLENGSLRGQAFDSLRARVQLNGDSLQIHNCRLAMGNARLDIDGQILLDSRQIEFGVKLDEFQISSLPAVQAHKLDLEGKFSAAGRFSGTLDNPSFEGSVELEGLRYARWDLGKGQGTVELRNKNLRSDASVRSDLGSFKFQANVSTEGNYAGKATLELKDWNLQKLVAGEIPPFLNDLSTALQGRVEIEGPFADPASLNYRGEVEGARFKLHDYELSNAGKIRFTVGTKSLHVDEATVVGEGTKLSLGGDIPVDGSAGLDLHLDGELNLKLLEQVEKKLQVTGSAGVNVRATGNPVNPQIIGKAAIKNARIDYGDLPFFVSGLQGQIVFSRNLIRFENLDGAMAGGSVELTGAVEHQNARVRDINLQLSARRARIPFPKDFRSTVDADLNLRGGPDAQVLSGEIRVIRGEYLRNYSLLEQLAGRSSAAPGPLTSEPLLAGLRLNVGIVSDDGLHIDNEYTKLRGGMHLTLRGTPAYPSLTGRLEATEGSIFFRGNRFEIVRGSADFLDRNRMNPRIEVRAEADVRTYRLVLDVTGDLDRLRFNVTSDPPMSTVDILTLLTTGKESVPGSDTTRRQAEITGLSAASILSESITGVLGKRVERIFGLQSFRVDPFLSGAGNDPTARITVSERIAKDLNVTFSRNLTTNEEQIIVVEYLVSRNVSIVGTRDENGNFGVDFRLRKRLR